MNSLTVFLILWGYFQRWGNRKLHAKFAIRIFCFQIYSKLEFIMISITKSLHTSFNVSEMLSNFIDFYFCFL